MLFAGVNISIVRDSSHNDEQWQHDAVHGYIILVIAKLFAK
jgi:hypothetical protein